jgi:hypothetical protein
LPEEFKMLSSNFLVVIFAVFFVFSFHYISYKETWGIKPFFESMILVAKNLGTMLFYLVANFFLVIGLLIVIRTFIPVEKMTVNFTAFLMLQVYVFFANIYLSLLFVNRVENDKSLADQDGDGYPRRLY